MGIEQSILDMQGAINSIGVALLIGIFAPVIVSTIIAIFKLRAFK